MQHDVDYGVCGTRKDKYGEDEKACKNEADRKMVKALDAVPWKRRQWGHAAARNVIQAKQKLGLGMWMDAGTSFRRGEVEKIKQALTERQAHHSETAGKFKNWHTRFAVVGAFSGALATLCPGSGLATSLSVAGLPVTGPLLALSIVLSMLSTSSICSVHFFWRRYYKHERLARLAEKTQSEVSSLLSTALTDGSISDTEYQEVNKKYGHFLSQRAKIRFEEVDGQKRVAHHS